MVLPIAAAAAQAFAEAARGVGNVISAKKQAKTSKKTAKIAAKEDRRRTKADFLSKALQRRYDAKKDLRMTQSDLAQERRRALAEMASGFREALLGG